MKPSSGPSGENGGAAPTAISDAVGAISARLRTKGTRLVRMTWMLSVCVKSDSTDHPVWNSEASAGSQQPKAYRITKKVA